MCILYNQLPVDKDLLIVSLIIFSVFSCVAFLGRRITQRGTDRVAKGTADDIIYLEFQKAVCNIPHDKFLLNLQDEARIQGRTWAEIQNRLTNSKAVAKDSSCERSHVKSEKVLLQVYRGQCFKVCCACTCFNLERLSTNTNINYNLVAVSEDENLEDDE